jgi:hypothetical protein
MAESPQKVSTIVRSLIVSRFVQRLLLLSLVLVATTMFSVKVWYVAQRFRFLVFGFDSARIFGYAMKLDLVGELDHHASNRYGLPVFIILLKHIFHVPPSRIGLGVFYVANYVSLGAIAVLTHTYFKSFKTTVLSLLVFSIMSQTMLLNDSNFMTFVILPLRLMVTYLLFTSAKHKQTGLLIVYWLTTFVSVFSYPLFALALDMFSLVLVVWRYGHKQQRGLIRGVILGHLTSYLSLIYVYEQSFDFHLSFEKFVERAYGFFLLSGGEQTFFRIITGFLVLQVGLLVGTFVTLSDRIVGTLDKGRNILFRWIHWVFTAIILWSVVKSIFGYANITLSFLSAESIEDLRLLYQTFYMLFFAFAGLLIGLSSNYRRNLNFVLRLFGLICLGYIVIYFFPYPNILSKTLRNSRFVLFFFVCVLPLVVDILSKSVLVKKLPVLVFLIFIMWPLSLGHVRIYFKQARNETVASAMDWFSQQPRFLNTIYYASYLNNPGIAPHEKTRSQIYAPTKYPWPELKKLATCTSQLQVCVQTYQEYISEHEVEYLIVEDQYTPLSQELLKLGEIIYDQGIHIIKV